jgi:hypothetical protein
MDHHESHTGCHGQHPGRCRGAWAAVPAAAGPLVDPSSPRQPPPPGADCRLDGAWIICHTSVDFFPVNEPIFDLPCGTLYETATDIRRGIRWHDNSTGMLVTRSSLKTSPALGVCRLSGLVRGSLSPPTRTRATWTSTPMPMYPHGP